MFNFKSYVVVGAMLVSGTASAQSPSFLAKSYQPFRMDSGVAGAAILSQESYGIAGFAEPKLNIIDNIAVGARFEGAIMMGGNIGAPGTGEVTVKQNVVVATLGKADFYMSRGSVRPWVGLGAGAYTIVGQGTSTSSGGASVSQKAGRYFGVAPQLGLEMGALRLSATYNKILGGETIVTQNVGGQDETKEYSADYFTVDLGFRFGGRRR